MVKLEQLKLRQRFAKTNFCRCNSFRPRIGFYPGDFGLIEIRGSGDRDLAV
jgi:hypothetical protein